MYTFEEWKKNLIIVRGGGDIATGTIYKLYQSRFPVLVKLRIQAAFVEPLVFVRQFLIKKLRWKE